MRLIAKNRPKVIVPKAVAEDKKTAERKTAEKVKEPKKSKGTNKLPTDEYRDEVTPIRIPLDENGDLVVSVKRGGEYGLPKVDIRLFVKTDTYTGFTKKGVNFDLDKLPELKLVLCDLIIDCDEKGLFDEFEDKD